MRIRKAIVTGLLLVAASVTAQIRAPATAYPGDPVAVTVISDSEVFASLHEGVSLTGASLAGGETQVLEARSFAVSMTPQVTVQCVLLGLPNTLTPGQYVLEIRHEREIKRLPLTLLPQEFRSEEIPLSRSLTQLRESDDPRKAVEARELQSLLFEFNQDAVYHAGPFSWPIPLTRRTSLFADRRTYLYADGATAFIIHSGLDLASPTGEPVASSGAGIVRMATYRIVTGNTVVVEHLPGVFSLYYHLDELTVQPGQAVAAGDKIGTVGATGLATGPHLHWEFRIGGVPVNPESVLPGLLVDFER